MSREPAGAEGASRTREKATKRDTGDSAFQVHLAILRALAARTPPGADGAPGRLHLGKNLIVDGLHVGRWGTRVRNRRRSGLLGLDRIAQLDSVPGWWWDAPAHPEREPLDLPAGIRHGTSTAYNDRGCRCTPCRNETSRLQRARQARIRARRLAGAVDVNDRQDTAVLRRHLRALKRAGVSYRHIAALAYADRTFVGSIANGRIKLVSEQVQSRLLAVTAEKASRALLDCQCIDGARTRERLEELLVLGWPAIWIARELATRGTRCSTELKIAAGPQVEVRTARAVLLLHRDIDGHAAPRPRAGAALRSLADLPGWQPEPSRLASERQRAVDLLWQGVQAAKVAAFTGLPVSELPQPRKYARHARAYGAHPS